MAIVISPSGPAIRFTNNEDGSLHVTVDNEDFGDFPTVKAALATLLEKEVLKSDTRKEVDENA